MRSSSWRRFVAAVLVAGTSLSMAACVSHVTVIEEEDSAGGGGGPPASWKGLFKDLVRHGVTIAVIARVIQFDGPVKGGAPLVVDFELAEEGFLRVDVAVKKKKRSQSFEFRAEGGERKVLTDTLRVDLGKWQAAKLSVAAFDPFGERQIEFDFFGIGVGERAVGSTGIYQVTFEPELLQGAESARWGFRTRSDFERAKIEVYRERLTRGGTTDEIIRTLQCDCPLRRGKRCPGNWDGLDKKGRRSKGRHSVWVTAWLESGLERDWIAEGSAEVVEVQ